LREVRRRGHHPLGAVVVRITLVRDERHRGVARRTLGMRAPDIGRQRTDLGGERGGVDAEREPHERRVESHRGSLSPLRARDRAGAVTQPVNLGVMTTGSGVGGGCTSNAPMSTIPSTTRAKPAPRWSNSLVGKVGTGLGPVLMAGLPASRAWVSVGPPLFCSGPSNGLAPKMVPPASVTLTPAPTTPSSEWSEVRTAPVGPPAVPMSS